jgi:hypothetical protein
MGRNAPKQAAAGHRPGPPSVAVGKAQALSRRPGKLAGKQHESESEDEGGRGEAFVSRKGGAKKATVEVKRDEAEGAMEVDDEAPIDGVEATTKATMEKQTSEAAPKKRKPTSFMDEILAEKSAKKKKKKKKAQGASATE